MHYCKICLLLALILGFSLAGCKKYLDRKPDQKLATATSTADLQAMLDHYGLFNTQYPSSLEVCSDDYFLPDAVFLAMTSESARNLYKWAPDDASVIDWNPPYERIYTANVILKALADVPGSTAEKQSIEGSAYFFRALNYFMLAGLFAPQYDPSNAVSSLGLPLRTDPDFNKPTVRATLAQTWELILSDIDAAIARLPETTIAKNRPTRAAGFALKARILLAMGKYDQVLAPVDSALARQSTLIDYNTLALNDAFPFKQFNAEVIFDAGLLVAQPLTQTRWRVDSNLYRTYGTNDLRKPLFFKANSDGSYAFKGSYAGSATPFAGIAVDELWLTRAEARTRTGNWQSGIQDLNTLLVKRYKTGTFQPQSAVDAQSALQLILSERRKQLVQRGTRWFDLRRLASDPLFGVTPKRRLASQLVELPPGSPRYTLWIPRSVIEFSGIAQNP
jgi:starch-binding outer membrane protein, SusD/RagB family